MEARECEKRGGENEEPRRGISKREHEGRRRREEVDSTRVKCREGEMRRGKEIGETAGDMTREECVRVYSASMHVNVSRRYL